MEHLAAQLALLGVLYWLPPEQAVRHLGSDKFVERQTASFVLRTFIRPKMPQHLPSAYYTNPERAYQEAEWWRQYYLESSFPRYHKEASKQTDPEIRRRWEQVINAIGR
jgi:hypothetical protein